MEEALIAFSVLAKRRRKAFSLYFRPKGLFWSFRSKSTLVSLEHFRWVLFGRTFRSEEEDERKGDVFRLRGIYLRKVAFVSSACLRSSVSAHFRPFGSVVFGRT